MTRHREDLQPSLFDEETPSIDLKPAQIIELAAVLEGLLREIAAAFAKSENRENSHE